MLSARTIGKNFTRLELYTRSSRQLFANPTALLTPNGNSNRRFATAVASPTQSQPQPATPVPHEPAKQAPRPMHAQYLEMRALLTSRSISDEDGARLRRLATHFHDLLRLKAARAKENANAKAKEEKATATSADGPEAEAERAATTPEAPEEVASHASAEQPPLDVPLPKTRDEYSTLLQLFVHLNEKEAGVALAWRMKKRGVHLRPVDCQRLIQLFAQGRAPPTAEEAAHATAMATAMTRKGTMRGRTSVFLLEVYARAGLHELAVATFRAIEERQLEATEKAQSRGTANEEGEAGDGQGAVVFTPGLRAYGNLIEMYAHANSHVQVDALWREMRAKYLLYPKIRTYIAMVAMYSRLDNVPAQVEIMDEMRPRFKEPQQYVCNVYLSVCAKAGNWRLGLDILADLRHRQKEMTERGVSLFHSEITEEWHAKISDRTEALVIELFKNLEAEERLQAVLYLQALMAEKSLARDLLFDCIFEKYLNEAATVDLHLKEGRA